MSQSVTLSGQAVVVTGAGRGLGAAHARLAAARGAAVIVNDVDADPASEVVEVIRAAGGAAIAHVADVSRREEANGLIDRCLAEHGRVDGLVNNAGLLYLASVEDNEETQARRLLEVNVLGVINCATAVLPHMRKAGRGSIVNVTSGAQMGMRFMSVYGASKGAVASFTYALAVETAGSGIRVNALSPIGQSRMTVATDQFYSGRNYAASSVEPSPDENAPVVAFLLSDAAEGVSGQVVRISGDRLSLLAHPAIVQPIVSLDQCTVESVAEAFEETLRSLQVPSGLTVVDLEVVEPAL